MNATLLLHIIDEAESTSSQNASYNWPELFVRLRGAARRLTGCAVDVTQTATYHRRWSLLQGGADDDVKPLLQAEMSAGTTAILNVPLLSLAKEEKKEQSGGHGGGSSTPLVPASSEDENDDGMECSNSNGDSSTPVKLTVSDVESVLGVLKTVINTPKSMSSVSSIVNRASGNFVSEILSEFSNLGGSGDTSLTTLENLTLISKVTTALRCYVFV